jgi:D-alanyl-lipoteichoic acid acyltransferase DltB (MBOAT superfamily)
MLFNSFSYALFLPLVFILYWFIFNRSLRLQNIFLILAGYVFYGWWDWRFLLLIAFSTTFDFFTGILIGKTEDNFKRRILFFGSCLINLGFLGVFKYYNFFIESLASGLAALGIQTDFFPLHIILPVGISFYTFQSLSYTADIYLRKIKPCHDFTVFAAFISFFPQLVAGPIERASSMIPQFSRERIFDPQEATLGMREMLWGFFKKIVIADSLSVYVDNIFANYGHLPGSTLALGAVYFAIQIYCDFSGYSLIARGTARLFGFTLMSNFNYPYFSQSPAQFWKSWHISLSTWFRDYVYIPLGGNRKGKSRTILNILIVFALSGLWHGANSTFIVWGLLNGLFILPSLFVNEKAITEEKLLFPSPGLLVKMLSTFLLITLAWIYFRSPDVVTAGQYINGIFSSSLLSYPQQHGMALALPLIALLFVCEWIMKNELIGFRNPKMSYIRWGVYLSASIICLAFFRQNQSFIYFQF